MPPPWLLQLPLSLIYSRLVLAAAVLALALLPVPHANVWICLLIITGLLTDVFDGIMARKLQVSTQRLRILDSNVDQVFWVAVLLATLVLHYRFFRTHWPEVALVAGLELACYGISYGRFGKPVATHTLLAKAWTLSLLAFLLTLFYTGSSLVSYSICFWLAVVSRLEIIVILLLLRQWHTDIPHLGWVKAINNGQPVRRHKLFHG